jgi:type IV secretory pathway VirB10-like protein
VNDFPSDERGVSPVGSGSRFLRTRSQKLLALCAACAVALSFGALAVRSIILDPGIKEKEVDIGATKIADTQTAPPPADDQSKTVAPIVIYTERPAAKIDRSEADKSQVVDDEVMSYPVVLMPAATGETLFEVPSVERPASAGAGGSDRAAASREAGAEPTRVDFKGETIAGGRAGKAIRMTYVMKRQPIWCVLDTALDTTHPGPIFMHTVKDVRSPANVLLIPAGATVSGSYKNEIRTGQHRVFAFAGSALTADGIPVPLNSIIADGLGSAGVEGNYDPHNLERFGAAIALTGIDVATQILTAEIQRNSSQTNLNIGGGGGGSGISSIAQRILQAQIDQPPTITLPPGTPVSIMVDHEIDFSDALKVTTRAR